MRTGLIVRKARKEKGLTLEQLGDAVYCSSAMLSRWEQGNSIAADRLARRVANDLNIDFNKLRVQLEEERYRRKRAKLDATYTQETGLNVVENCGRQLSGNLIENWRWRPPDLSGGGNRSSLLSRN